MLSKARAFVGTYGGTMQLAVRLGLPSAGFYEKFKKTAYAHKLLNYGAAHAAFPSPRALSPCFELSHVTVRTSTTTRVQAQEWTRAIARWKAGPCLCPGVLPDCVPTNGNSWRARYTSPPLPSPPGGDPTEFVGFGRA